jgi:TDG/mug DNA glycosylase family protein
VVAFVGVSLYQVYFRLPKSGGPGAKPEQIAGARVFVVPNPSGLNASFPGFQEKLVWFRKLRVFLGQKPRAQILELSKAGRRPPTEKR